MTGRFGKARAGRPAPLGFGAGRGDHPGRAIDAEGPVDQVRERERHRPGATAAAQERARFGQDLLHGAAEQDQAIPECRSAGGDGAIQRERGDGPGQGRTGAESSVEICNALLDRFYAAAVHRPLRLGRYDAGRELTYEATAVSAGRERAQVRLAVERFVGGGYGGQVYRVRVLAIARSELPGLRIGEAYALKLFVPPSAGARLFRDTLYAIGFQGPFQLQCNLSAARAAALWQKFIRRGARVWFGDGRVVNDVHATLVDSVLGCCGEISEWVDGRTWPLEVDDRLDYLALWRRGRSVDSALLGSPEYRAKREFMRSVVRMLHAMGAYELARQYEWWTCKSQPNCLKRRDSEGDAQNDFVAVDFRPGLTLLPFLPMSPGDVLLIAQGLGRGSLVQFDRGDLRKLRRFVDVHADAFADMRGMLEELLEADRVYRESIPDITYHGLRLAYSRRLWRTMLASAVSGWRVRNLIDDRGEQRLAGRPAPTLLFAVLGLLPLLGRFLRRVWCHEAWRRHYAAMLNSLRYLRRALEARRAETVLRWYRAGRLADERALRVTDRALRFILHLPFALLPAGLHRFLTDWAVFRQRLRDVFVRPIRLCFNAVLREEWLRELVEEGRRKSIVSDDDAETIVASIKEPFIQKYLKGLAVHAFTLPLTSIISVSIALGYVFTHPEVPRAQAWALAAAIVALFYVIPFSPGSLTRGLYVFYLVIRERNLKDYNIALAVGFFKKVGYLAFPIQMAYRYPALARLMAAHWATDLVHMVPVFGERGALLERWAFDLFYNWPLTIRRRVRERSERRASLPPRRWHVLPLAAAAAAALATAEHGLWAWYGLTPHLTHVGWLLAALALVNGGLITMAAGGSGLRSRVLQAALGGLAVGVFAALAPRNFLLVVQSLPAMDLLIPDAVSGAFIATLLSTIGAIATELLFPDPKVRVIARK